MGSFNVLIMDLNCSNCNKVYEARIQFKYGHTRQLEYRVGDKLQWGGNDIGKPGAKKVKVYGILESDQCPICEKENENEEFDILIEEGIIIGASRMKEYDYWDEGNYKILVE